MVRASPKHAATGFCFLLLRPVLMFQNRLAVQNSWSIAFFAKVSCPWIRFLIKSSRLCPNLETPPLLIWSVMSPWLLNHPNLDNVFPFVSFCHVYQLGYCSAGIYRGYGKLVIHELMQHVLCQTILEMMLRSNKSEVYSERNICLHLHSWTWNWGFQTQNPLDICHWSSLMLLSGAAPENVREIAGDGKTVCRFGKQRATFVFS